MVDVPGPLRVVFFGTPGFAVPTLDALLGSVHAVAAVVTQPDKPRGRGQHRRDGPVKELAVANGVPVWQPVSLKDPAFRDQLARASADLGVVAAYGKLLPEGLLAMPRLGMINVHASLLPKYRGAAPIHRAVAAGELETGISIMRVVKALDAGPVLATVRRPIGPDETSLEVERGLALLGARLLVDTVDRLAIAAVSETAQDDQAATYASRLTKDDGLVDWTRPARQLHNLVRAMHPWPHAQTSLNGRRLILHRASWLGSSLSGAAPSGLAFAPPGTILAASGHQLHVATGDGILRIEELQAEGSRVMSTRDFLAGHRLRIGDHFERHVTLQ